MYFLLMFILLYVARYHLPATQNILQPNADVENLENLHRFDEEAREDHMRHGQNSSIKECRGPN